MDKQEWTLDSLHHHLAVLIEQIDSDLRGQINRRIEAEESQRLRLETHIEMRLEELRSRIEQLNGLRREALEDRAQFITRDAMDAREDKLSESLRRLEDTLGKCVPLASYQATVDEWTRWREGVNKTVQELLVGPEAVREYRMDRRAVVQPWQLWAATGAVSVVIVLTNLLLAHV